MTDEELKRAEELSRVLSLQSSNDLYGGFYAQELVEVGHLLPKLLEEVKVCADQWHGWKRRAEVAERALADVVMNEHAVNCDQCIASSENLATEHVANAIEWHKNEAAAELAKEKG